MKVRRSCADSWPNQQEVEVERLRHEGECIFLQHLCEDQANCVANGWRIAVASKMVLATWSHKIERKVRQHSRWNNLVRICIVMLWGFQGVSMQIVVRECQTQKLLVAHFTCAQMVVCWSQYGTVRFCVPFWSHNKTVIRHATYPLLPFGPSTQLEFCFVSVGLSNFLMERC